MLVGRTRLTRDLTSLGLRSGAVAMVHCRMSALGSVVGGAETVIGALLDVVGPAGTLVAYTGWQDGPPDDLDALAPADRELILARIVEYDGQVVLLGAPLSAVTLVHHAEALARVEASGGSSGGARSSSTGSASGGRYTTSIRVRERFPTTASRAGRITSHGSLGRRSPRAPVDRARLAPGRDI